MKTIQPTSATSWIDLETMTINLGAIPPGMVFAIALGGAVFVAGVLATIAVRRGWL
mgnify:FL=1